MENLPTVKNTTVFNVTVFTLAFVGFGGLYWGSSLLIDPSGKLVEIPIEILSGLDIKNYFIPGLIVFFCLGLCSLGVSVYSFFEKPRYPLFVILQGIILITWTVIQIAMIGVKGSLQLIYGYFGILLIILGIILQKKCFGNNKEKTIPS